MTQEHADSDRRAVAQVLAGYRSGFTLVSGDVEAPLEEFALVPARGTPRLLLPRSPKALRASLKTFAGQRCWIELASIALSTSFRSRLTSGLLAQKLSLVSAQTSTSPMRERFAALLGHSDFHLALRLSFARPNAKTVVAAVADSGEILCFAKIGSESMTDDLVRHESSVLESFARQPSPVLVPRVLDAGPWAEEFSMLVTEPLQLKPLPGDATVAHQAADALASSQGTTTSPLSESVFWLGLVERLARDADDDNGGASINEAVERIRDQWGDIPLELGVSHGDWSRANVGLVDGRVAAFDWERCSTQAPRGIDIAHFAILEASSRSRGAALDVASIATSVREYLRAANRPDTDAEFLTVLDLLEMVARFRAARRAGLQARDSKFAPAINAAMGLWLT